MTANTITAAGYVCYDHTSSAAIYGTGVTEQDAWEDALEWLFRDGRTEDHNRDDFTITPATAELLALVERDGGAIAWGRFDGIACTTEQEEAALLDDGA